MNTLFSFILVIAMTGILIAATPILTKHRTMEEIDDELNNIYLTMQDQEFTTVFGTPTASSMFKGRIVVASTGTVKFCVSVDTITVYCTPALTVTNP